MPKRIIERLSVPKNSFLRRRPHRGRHGRWHRHPFSILFGFPPPSPPPHHRGAGGATYLWGRMWEGEPAIIDIYIYIYINPPLFAASYGAPLAALRDDDSDDDEDDEEDDEDDDDDDDDDDGDCDDDDVMMVHDDDDDDDDDDESNPRID